MIVGHAGVGDGKALELRHAELSPAVAAGGVGVGLDESWQSWT